MPFGALFLLALAGDGSAATFVVTSTADSGPGSLRQAIVDANASPGSDVIAFSIPGAGPHKILPASPLPALTDPVTINALTQPGADCSSWPADLRVELDGTGMTGASYGLQLSGGASTVRGLVINGFRLTGSAGVFIDSDGNAVECNFIGTDVTGTVGTFALRNDYGVLIDDGNDNMIGGTTLAARNLISNNDEDGVRLRNGATGNIIAGNFIGTNASGTSDLLNSDTGVFVLSSPGNLIGGDDHDAGVCNHSCNLISGNDDYGIEIEGEGADNNVIQGNFIGVDISGAAALPNRRGGVSLSRAPTEVVGNGGHLIGGATMPGVCSGPCNVISGNNQRGIRDGVSISDVVIQGNFIGTDASGTAAVPNQNSGIDLSGTSHLVGGASPGLGNVISGNGRDGLEAVGANIVVQGNLIGTAVDGVTPLGNLHSGVRVSRSTKIIGGTDSGEGNTIAYNGQQGIEISASLGPPIDTGNALLGNSIHSNGLLGIDFGNNGVTGNDTGEADNLQNFPVLDGIPTTTGAGSTNVSGTLNSHAATDFRLEFFASEACDPSGFGQAHTFIGATTVTTDASGNTSFNQSFSTSGVPSGWVVTSTATRLSPDGDPLSTSELSQCAPISGSTMVTTTAETGPGSLADAILFSNLTNGSDVISFDIDPATDPNCNPTTGVCVIQGLQPPPITGTVTVDGLSQPGASCAAWPPTLKIQVKGRLEMEGLASLVRGISVFAIDLDGADHTLRCNFVGTNASGTAPIPDFGGGTLAVNGPGHTIGGLAETDRNLISGHNVGIRLASVDTVVQGNFIGTDVTGLSSLPNQFAGIWVIPGSGGLTGTNIIGGTTGTLPAGSCSGACNLISGNAGEGIRVDSAGVAAVNSVIEGNFIGTDVSGTGALGNTRAGIRIQSDGNTVGGIVPAAQNKIAHNGESGVAVVSGGSDNIAGIGNRIVGNAIFSNAGLGIDLEDDGATTNDPGDGDEGANNLQNFPDITAVTGDDATLLSITYSVPSTTANSAYPLRIEFFLADADGEEGRTFIGAATYPSGDAEQSVTAVFSPVWDVQSGDLVLATATDADGNTSEFSAAMSSNGGAGPDAIFADRFEEQSAL